MYLPILEYLQNEIFSPQDYSFVMAGCGKEQREIVLIVPIVDEKPYFEEASMDPAQFDRPWVLNRLASYGDNLSFARINVAIVTLDQFDLAPDVCKIDAEGAEFDVLEGMIKTIRTHFPIFLIENNDWNRVTPYLAQLGYEAYRYDAEADHLSPMSGVTANTFYLRHDHFATMIRQMPG
jgi:FkbM family methyltransferase